MDSSSSTRIFLHSVLVAGILFFNSTCLPEKAPYYTFAKDATQAPPVAYYDYIVVGGGTSGCALAATLSPKSKVLLLERGGLPYGHPTINSQATALDTLADISQDSPSQPFTSTDGVINTRARVLGGGSCLNAGFYTRASTTYVDRVGWDHKLVNQSYEWVERKVVFEPPMLQWQSAVRDALLEVGVEPDNGFTYDHIYGTKVGGSIFDKTGHRHTTADLLEYADPTMITLFLNATVYEIYFQVTGETGEGKPRATGVEFRDAKGNIHRAYLNQGSINEVILSSGALGSPQLLMLSGIGPKLHLAFHNIDLVLDQPNVGQGMSDNPMNGIIIPTHEPVEISLIQVVGITKSESYIETVSGLRFNQGLANQTFHNMLKLIPDSGRNLNLGVIVEKVAGPSSAGHLVLHTRDPKDNPVVTFNYFKDPVDLQRCVQGMKTIIQVIESNSFRKFRDVPLSVPALLKLVLDLPLNARPKHPSSLISLEQYCIDTVMTIWHYHGGCQVGKVVDNDYKVFGVDALRVIDGSTLINSPGTNPQATLMMLGRYMGQKIVQERFPRWYK